MKLETYSTLDDYWLELNQLTRDLDMQDVRGTTLQQEYIASAWDDRQIYTRLTFRWGRVTSLQVGKANEGHNNIVTRLDFMGTYTHGVQHFTGHLLVKGLMPEQPNGLHIRESLDIPEPQRNVLNEGVTLL